MSIGSRLAQLGRIAAASPIWAGQWASRNPRAGASVFGTGLGAAYGAFSNDTSVLGGAARGFAIGTTGYIGYRGVRAGVRAGTRAYKAGFSLPWSAYAGVTTMGGSMRAQTRATANMLQRSAISSFSYIGQTARRAYGRIRGLGSR